MPSFHERSYTSNSPVLNGRAKSSESGLDDFYHRVFGVSILPEHSRADRLCDHRLPANVWHAQ
jgi:hypothetical protein